MKQYAVVAHDYSDDEALERRLSRREAHLEGIRQLAGQGRFLSGGAILDDAGRMVGSSVHVQFPDRRELDDWLATEPYVTGKVWERIEIREVKLFDPGA